MRGEFSEGKKEHNHLCLPQKKKKKHLKQKIRRQKKDPKRGTKEIGDGKKGGFLREKNPANCPPESEKAIFSFLERKNNRPKENWKTRKSKKSPWTLRTTRQKITVTKSKGRLEVVCSRKKRRALKKKSKSAGRRIDYHLENRSRN